jgi:ribonuclease HII
LKTPGPDLSFEKVLWQAGVGTVAGIDEAGRGALAGPVAAAAVILPTNENIILALAGVRDSKQMTPAQRNQWSVEIKSGECWGLNYL